MLPSHCPLRLAFLRDIIEKNKPGRRSCDSLEGEWRLADNIVSPCSGLDEVYSMSRSHVPLALEGTCFLLR